MRIRPTFRALRAGLLLPALILMLAGCSSYQVRFFYPQQNPGDFFSEAPKLSLFVAQPQDLRPGRERNGSGIINTFRFPSDENLEQPAASIVRRSLMQDLLQTRIATLVQNPALADYTLESHLVSFTTKLSRPLGAWAVPLGVGFMGGVAMAAEGDGVFGKDNSDLFKLSLVGAFVATFIPLPARSEARVELLLKLKDQETGEVVWQTSCEGIYSRMVRLGLTARDDKRLAEEFLPRAMKTANACAVGQLFAYLQEEGDAGVGR